MDQLTHSTRSIAAGYPGLFNLAREVRNHLYEAVLTTSSGCWTPRPGSMAPPQHTVNLGPLALVFASKQTAREAYCMALFHLEIRQRLKTPGPLLFQGFIAGGQELQSITTLVIECEGSKFPNFDVLASLDNLRDLEIQIRTQDYWKVTVPLVTTLQRTDLRSRLRRLAVFNVHLLKLGRMDARWPRLRGAAYGIWWSQAETFERYMELFRQLFEQVPVKVVPDRSFEQYSGALWTVSRPSAREYGEYVKGAMSTKGWERVERNRWDVCPLDVAMAEGGLKRIEGTEYLAAW